MRPPKIVYCEICSQPLKPVAEWLDSGQWCKCKEIIGVLKE